MTKENPRQQPGGKERKMPMAYSETRRPENSYGVKVPFRVLWRRRLATKKVTAYRRYLARMARKQRALDDFGRRLEAAHATQKDMLPLFVECRVRYRLGRAPRTPFTATRTRAPRPRATRRTRRACRVEAPPGGDDSGSSDLPPAPTWGHPSHDSTTVDLSFQSSPWRLPSGLRALLAYALLEVDA